MSTKRGFTLIELLVVIAIIGILSSVVLASLNSARQKSRDARRISDQNQVRLALELYFDSNNGTYPLATTSLVTEFMPSYPSDPGSATGYDYWSNGTYYCVGAVLEDSTHAATANNSSTCVSTVLAGAGGESAASPNYALSN